MLITESRGGQLLLMLMLLFPEVWRAFWDDSETYLDVLSVDGTDLSGLLDVQSGVITIVSSPLFGGKDAVHATQIHRQQPLFVSQRNPNRSKCVKSGGVNLR